MKKIAYASGLDYNTGYTGL